MRHRTGTPATLNIRIVTGGRKQSSRMYRKMIRYDCLLRRLRFYRALCLRLRRPWFLPPS